MDDKPLVLSNTEIQYRKTPDIPQKYYDSLLNAVIHIVETKTTPPIHLASACMILILSQTGLRISELLDLRCGCIKVKLSRQNKNLHYLEYKTWKREQGNNVFTTMQTFANQYVILGYETLLSLYKKERLDLQTDCLFLRLQKRKDQYSCLVTKDSFNHQLKGFYIFLNHFFPTINLSSEEQKNLRTCNIDGNVLARKQNKDAQTLTYPSSMQYRVHVCTELYSKGVPLAYIKKFMGHLTNEMAGYYVRTEKYCKQENEDYAKAILYNILSGTEKLMGNDISSLQNRIQTFMQEEGIYVEKDLNLLIEKIAGKLPIRQKAGGVCIRSSMERECSMDARTNEFYCAYGVCPNLFHFYHMADVSYQQASSLWKSVLYNETAGFKRQAYKDLGVLHTLTRQKLNPEILELQKEVAHKGKIYVLDKYPNLKKIISNLTEIEKEIELWSNYRI